MPTNRRNALPLLLPFLFLFLFAGDLLKTFFSANDCMNLYKYLEGGWGVLKGIVWFWSSAYYRPLGAALYLPLYSAVGLHPIAFKVVALALLIVNLALALYIARLLTGSILLTGLAGILFAYHAAETELFYSFGSIYDILCFTLLYAAFAMYIRVRERHQLPGPSVIALVCVLQILALDAKEMAVILPALLVLYELLLRHQWSPKLIVTPALTAAISLIYIVGKGSGSESLTANAQYRPEISFHNYLLSMSHYWNLLLYRDDLRHLKFAAVMTALVLIAPLVARSRLAFFCALWFVIGMLPLNFILIREGYVLYIPLLALAVWAIALWRDVVPARWAESPIPLVLVALAFAFIDHREKRLNDPPVLGPIAINASFASGLEQQNSNPARGSHILFLDDPYPLTPIESWMPQFIPALVRDDLTVKTARVKQNMLVLAPNMLPLFQEYYDYSAGRLQRVNAAELPGRLASVRQREGFVEAGEGVWLEANASMWTRRVFNLKAACGEGQSHCRLNAFFSVPTDAYPTSRAHWMTFAIDGSNAASAQLYNDVDMNTVDIDLPGGGSHTVTFTFDATVPLARHPTDPRELGVVLLGAVVK